MQDMKPQEPDPRSSPESWQGGGLGLGSLGTLEPRAQGGGHSLDTARGGHRLSGFQEGGPWQVRGEAKERGQVSAMPPKPEEPVRVQFRPLPRSQILIRARSGRCQIHSPAWRLGHPRDLAA